MWWVFDGEKVAYCYVRYFPRVAAGDGGEHAIDCWGALTPEEDRREGGKGQHLGKGALEGGGPTVPA